MPYLDFHLIREKDTGPGGGGGWSRQALRNLQGGSRRHVTSTVINLPVITTTQRRK